MSKIVTITEHTLVIDIIKVKRYLSIILQVVGVLVVSGVLLYAVYIFIWACDYVGVKM